MTTNTSTPMEKIKAFHSIKPFVTQQELDSVAEMLGLTEEDQTRRIQGKEAEYEFLLRCFLLDELKDIVAFEEGVSRLTDTITTDFLFITKKGRRIVVEVKSTEKQEWKISEKVITDKENFAANMNAELYFAIRIQQYWLFLSSDYIRRNGKKIKATNIPDSEFHIIGEKSFLLFNSLTIKSTYNSDLSKSIGITHPEYGGLERYSLEVNKHSILKVSHSSKEKLLIHTIALEAIQDAASNQIQEIHRLDAKRTLVIETLEANCQFQLSHLLIAPIRHILHELHETYDFSTYVTEIVDAKKKSFVNPHVVLHTLGLLAKNGLEIGEVHGKNIRKFEDIYDLSAIK